MFKQELRHIQTYNIFVELFENLNITRKNKNNDIYDAYKNIAIFSKWDNYEKGHFFAKNTFKDTIVHKYLNNHKLIKDKFDVHLIGTKYNKYFEENCQFTRQCRLEYGTDPRKPNGGKQGYFPMAMYNNAKQIELGTEPKPSKITSNSDMILKVSLHIIW